MSGGTPCGTCTRPRVELALFGVLTTSIETTAGVTLLAIATKALLASAIGWTTAAAGRACAKASFVQLNPAATINSPAQAVIEGTVRLPLLVPIGKYG